MIWQIELIKRYPHLFRSEFPEKASGYPTVGDGWQPIVEKAIERIDAAVSKQLKDGKAVFRITQIKEKLGGLRIYVWTVLPPEIDARVMEAIDLAAARAEVTCDVCGAAGQLHSDGFLLATRCEAHAHGRPLTNERRRPDGLHIKWTIEEGEKRVVACRRYDRERDAFVDAPLPPGERWSGRRRT